MTGYIDFKILTQKYWVRIALTKAGLAKQLFVCWVDGRYWQESAYASLSTIVELQFGSSCSVVLFRLVLEARVFRPCSADVWRAPIGRANFAALVPAILHERFASHAVPRLLQCGRRALSSLSFSRMYTDWSLARRSMPTFSPISSLGKHVYKKRTLRSLDAL